MPAFRTSRMIAVLAGAAALLSTAVSGAGAAPEWQPLQPVSSLDVERYLGEWYQLAAVPLPFNLECARDSRANYALRDATNIRVENTCTTWIGTTSRVVGNARVNDPETNAQLHVSFSGVPGQDAVDGPTNYVVAALADDYSWALVGDPARVSAFVLSRTPSVPPETWATIRETAERNGFNTCLILTTPTTIPSAIRPLCVV